MTVLIGKAFSTFAGLAALLVVFEEDGRDKRLQIHHVLVEVARVLVLPDPSFQIVLPRFPRSKDIDARTVLCHTNQQQITRMPRLALTQMRSCRRSHLPARFCPQEVQACSRPADRPASVCWPAASDRRWRTPRTACVCPR